VEAEGRREKTKIEKKKRRRSSGVNARDSCYTKRCSKGDVHGGTATRWDFPIGAGVVKRIDKIFEKPTEQAVSSGNNAGTQPCLYLLSLLPLLPSSH
jgi:hypothetical protein